MHTTFLRRCGAAAALTIGALAAAPVGAATVFNEDFDGVIAPALPVGWIASSSSGFTLFTTSALSPFAGVNSAHVNTLNSNDTRLVSPSISMAGASNGVLTFANRVNIETGFDGAMLEASLNGGGFADILALGGSFISGGYDGIITTGFGNSLEGRQAWTVRSTAYITTSVDLPASFDGQNVQFRWRMGSDGSVTHPGWDIDSVVLTADVGPTTTVPGPAPLALLAFGGLAALARRRRT